MYTDDNMLTPRWACRQKKKKAVRIRKQSPTAYSDSWVRSHPLNYAISNRIQETPKVKFPSSTHSKLNSPKPRNPRTVQKSRNPDQPRKRGLSTEETTRSLERPLHFDYLEKELKNTFGLPTKTGQMVTISSFDGVALAAGYDLQLGRGCTFACVPKIFFGEILKGKRTLYPTLLHGALGE